MDACFRFCSVRAGSGQRVRRGSRIRWSTSRVGCASRRGFETEGTIQSPQFLAAQKAKKVAPCPRRRIWIPATIGIPVDRAIFPADPHAGNLLTQTQKLLRKSFLTLDGTPTAMPGRKPSRMPLQCSPAKPSSEAGASVARPARSLSFRAAQANARGYFRGGQSETFCKCKKTVDAFRKFMR
jgi:hypothetical protein